MNELEPVMEVVAERRQQAGQNILVGICPNCNHQLATVEATPQPERSCLCGRRVKLVAPK